MSVSPGAKPVPHGRFDESLEQLEGIAQDLEEGDLGLEQALERYEEGVKLLRRCHELLERAERRIEVLSGVDAEGNPVVEPFHDPAEEGSISGAAGEGTTLEQKGAGRSARRTTKRTPPPRSSQGPMDDPPRLF